MRVIAKRYLFLLVPVVVASLALWRPEGHAQAPPAAPVLIQVDKAFAVDPPTTDTAGNPQGPIDRYEWGVFLVTGSVPFRVESTTEPTIPTVTLVTGVAEGEYYFRARAIDENGNASDWSSPPFLGRWANDLVSSLPPANFRQE